MITQEQIKRINELAHKAKAEGLNESEKKEQAKLRELYVSSFKENLVAQLNNTYPLVTCFRVQFQVQCHFIGINFSFQGLY